MLLICASLSEHTQNIKLNITTGNPDWYRLTRVVPDKIQRALNWLYWWWWLVVAPCVLRPSASDAGGLRPSDVCSSAESYTRFCRLHLHHHRTCTVTRPSPAVFFTALSANTLWLPLSLMLMLTLTLTTHTHTHNTHTQRFYSSVDFVRYNPAGDGLVIVFQFDAVASVRNQTAQSIGLLFFCIHYLEKPVF